MEPLSGSSRSPFAFLPLSSTPALFFCPRSTLVNSSTPSLLSLFPPQVSMSLHQLGVLIYGETPGDIGPAQGATGLFKHSHFAVCEVQEVIPRILHGHCHTIRL